MAFHGELAKGYFKDKMAGLFLEDSVHEFARKFQDTKDLHASTRENARKNAVMSQCYSVSMDLRRDFAAIGIIEALGG